MKAPYMAVVHEGEFAADKRVAVKLYDGKTRRGGAHVGKDAGTAYDTGEMKKVNVVPRGGNVLEEGGLARYVGRVPRKAETISVKGLIKLVAMKTLMDNRVFRLRNQRAYGNFLTKIKDKTADGSTSRSNSGGLRPAFIFFSDSSRAPNRAK